MACMIIDSSVALSLAFREEFDEYSVSAMSRVRFDGALVPSIWPLEIANILSSGTKRGRISEADVGEYFRLLGALPIEVVAIHPDSRRLYDLAGQYSLTAYDASYLELAVTSGLPLASKDDDLNIAAEKAGVKLWSP